MTIFSHRRRTILFIVGLLATTWFIHTGRVGTWTFFGAYVDWPKIQLFLSQNNEGFFLAAVIAIYMEVIRPSSLSDMFAAELSTLDSFLQNTSNADGVSFFLLRQYGGHDRVADLKDTVVSTKPVLLQCRIEMWLSRRGALELTYERRYRIVFDAVIDEFVLGFARSAAIAERLFHDARNVTEVVVLSKGDDFRSLYGDILAQSPVKIAGQSTELKRLSAKAGALSGGGLKRGEDYELFSAQTGNTKGELQQFSIDYTKQVANEAFGRHYWIADRPMFVRDIKIDVRAFYSDETIQFDVIPFLGSVGNLGKVEFAKGECLLVVNRWLVRGQGYCLVWGPIGAQRSSPE